MSKLSSIMSVIHKVNESLCINNYILAYNLTIKLCAVDQYMPLF